MAPSFRASSDIDSAPTLGLFRDWVFKYHGLPTSLISDRGTTFKSMFPVLVRNGWHFSEKLSTAFHRKPTVRPATHQRYQPNRYLRGYCNYHQDNWSVYKPWPSSRVTVRLRGLKGTQARYGLRYWNFSKTVQEGERLRGRLRQEREERTVEIGRRL